MASQKSQKAGFNRPLSKQKLVGGHDAFMGFDKNVLLYR